jgi:hypothetical protein
MKGVVARANEYKGEIMSFLSSQTAWVDQFDVAEAVACPDKRVRDLPYIAFALYDLHMEGAIDSVMQGGILNGVERRMKPVYRAKHFFLF